MPNPLAPLPIGINSLQTLIEHGMTYVDKTSFAYELARLPGRYFLSRPCRFGKSLFLDTLKELVEGNEALFLDLAIHERWDWSRRYPVILLDFAGGVIESRAALDRRIERLLHENAERLGVSCDWSGNDIPGCFGDLIRAVRQARGERVVILVDEYDKPILDNIDRPEQAAEVREGLKNLYSTMKTQDAHIHLILIKLLQQRRTFLPSLEGIEASQEILDSFDIERIDPVTLLFQTGYLTIEGTREAFGQELFALRLPNQEVRQALSNHLVDAYTGRLASERLAWQEALYAPLARGDVDQLIAAIRRLFAGIPWRNFTGNDLSEAEGYYASVLYAFFASLNAEIIPEDISNQGQVDLTVKLAGFIYIVEIKLRRGPTPEAETASVAVTGVSSNPALAQIRARRYSDKYLGLPIKGLLELGLVFDARARNLVQADWVTII